MNLGSWLERPHSPNYGFWLNLSYVDLGFPCKFIPTKAENLKSNPISEICKLLRADKSQTTPYNPKSDGLVESVANAYSTHKWSSRRLGRPSPLFDDDLQDMATWEYQVSSQFHDAQTGSSFSSWFNNWES